MMTPKQRKFARLVGTTDKSQTDCAIEAGYSVPTAVKAASRLMTYPAIQARIAKYHESDDYRAIANRKERLEWATAVIRGEIKEKRTTLAGESFECEPSLNTKLHALEIINRMTGADAPIRKEISGPGGKPLQLQATKGYDLSKLSSDDIRQLEIIEQKLIENC